MTALQKHPQLELQVVAAGTMVLERFQQPVNVVRGDGFPIDGEVYMELEGSTPTTMAKSVGLALSSSRTSISGSSPTWCSSSATVTKR